MAVLQRPVSVGQLGEDAVGTDFALVARAHVAELRGLVALEDDDALGADPVGVLELALEAAPGKVDLDREPGRPHLSRQGHRPAPLARVDDGDERIALALPRLLAER